MILIIVKLIKVTLKLFFLKTHLYYYYYYYYYYLTEESYPIISENGTIGLKRAPPGHGMPLLASVSSNWFYK